MSQSPKFPIYFIVRRIIERQTFVILARSSFRPQQTNVVETRPMQIYALRKHRLLYIHFWRGTMPILHDGFQFEETSCLAAFSTKLVYVTILLTMTNRFFHRYQGLYHLYFQLLYSLQASWRLRNDQFCNTTLRWHHDFWTHNLNSVHSMYVSMCVWGHLKVFCSKFKLRKVFTFKILLLILLLKTSQVDSYVLKHFCTTTA